MKKPLISLLFPAVLLFSCSDINVPENKRAGDSTVKKDDSNKSVLSKLNFNVSAYLIYNDGTLSSFDVLNDKSVALWNVISGGGDALRPSDDTKIKLNGDIDSLNIKIRNGVKLVIDTNFIHASQNFEFVIHNTGCNEVYVNI